MGKKTELGKKINACSLGLASAPLRQTDYFSCNFDSQSSTLEDCMRGHSEVERLIDDTASGDGQTTDDEGEGSIQDGKALYRMKSTGGDHLMDRSREASSSKERKSWS